LKFSISTLSEAAHPSTSARQTLAGLRSPVPAALAQAGRLSYLSTSRAVEELALSLSKGRALISHN